MIKATIRGLVLAMIVSAIAVAADKDPDPEPGASLHSDIGQNNAPNFDAFEESTWSAIESSVDRGLDFLVQRQNVDGSFGPPNITATGITGIAGMALISRGHIPDTKPLATPHAKAISLAIDYVLGVAKPNGLLSLRQSDYRHLVLDKSAMYNHAIAGLFLCEVYGMVDRVVAERIEEVIPDALDYVRTMQLRPLEASAEKRDRGGWRYDPAAGDGGFSSDLSVTAWIVMFMRSAENAGFDVPKDWADQAIGYVKRCYISQRGGFSYSPGASQMVTRAMVGAGVLCMSLTGNEDVRMQHQCGVWLRANPPTHYNRRSAHEHYHYSLYYGSQAALQLGKGTWPEAYRAIYQTLLENQNQDGSWQPESRRPELGNEYTTALCVLALTPPYQLLPIYQR